MRKTYTKLTRRQVHQICRRLKKSLRTETYQQIADDYGVSEGTIGSIKSGYTHRDISDRYFSEDFRNQRRRSLTCGQVKDLGLLRKEINDESAIIRELHVYGEAAELGKKGKVQHKGLGKQLLDEAEKLAKNYWKNKIIVISGVGARNYYKKFGYKKQGVYMVKKI